MINNIEKIIKYSHNLKLLYVEDSLDARESTLLVLEEFFDNIVVAINGEEGLARFKDNDIDIIITDINMPKLNGFDMIEKIREIDKKISILVLSAYDESSFVKKINLGIKDYLLKPIDMEQFLSVLNVFVDKLELKIVSKQNELPLKEKEINDFEVLSLIKDAIEDFKIISYFQPIINSKTKEIEKYESLVRLIDKEGEVLSPFYFLEIAKQNKYYSQISDIVLTNSFGVLSVTTMDISINLSYIDMEQEATKEKIFELLRDHRENAHRIIFEFSEADIKDFELTKQFVSQIKKFGSKVAIDNFNLVNICFDKIVYCEADILKISADLIKSSITDKNSLEKIHQIITFAKKHHIKIIVGFIENEEIFNVFNSLEIDYFQGYYFGKPKPLI